MSHRNVISSLLFCLLTLLLMAPRSAAGEEPGHPGPVRGFVTAGVGMPDLLHVEAGWFVSPRLSLEAHADWIVFNPMLGVGATLTLGRTTGERAPRHGFLLNAQALVNPMLGGLELESHADVLAATTALYAGYGFLADSGFYLRLLAGGLFYLEGGGLAAGPNVTIGAGWAF